MSWNKDADWLPLSNAMAQVRFWKQDLMEAEDFLKYVEGLPRAPNWKQMYKEAMEDVAESKTGLKKARLKLEESKNLE